MDEEGYLANPQRRAEQVKTEFGHYMGLVNESYVSNWQWGGSKIENQGVATTAHSGKP